MLDKITKARNIHIVGLSGTEGAAVALFLKGRKIPFTAHDFAEKPRFAKNFSSAHMGLSPAKREKMLKKLQAFGEKTNYGKDYLKGIEAADLIFVSQNWEAYEPNQKLHEIFARDPKRFATITQLYFDLFPGKILAVTGTNGKSTTTKLIAEIMSTASRQKTKSSRHRVDKVWFTGNDRRNVQIIDCLLKWQKTDWLVIEVSNRQLKFELGRAPNIGVITNVTDNHLNEYGGSFEKYKAGKYSLISKQTKADIAVLNADNEATAEFIKKTKATPLPYSVDKKLSTGARVDSGNIVYSTEWTASRQRVDKVVCPVDKIQLLGIHNLSNVLAAVAATHAAGVDLATIKKVITRFRGIPQRLELVAQKAGVKFINDSASTSPDSAIAALRSFPAGSIHLIAGGDPKGMDFAILAKEIQKQKARVILLKSPAGKAIAGELQKLKLGFEIVENLQQAVIKSAKNAQKGEYVLLSPSAAWFCYFNGKIPLGGKGFELFVRKLT
jgi:UDP-N-acetylmuramoylalanine--D-glutamate ligase